MGESSITYHLTPLDVWRSFAGFPLYRPEAFEREGFIHCTDGPDRVIETGNRYYQSDPRPFCVLVIDVDRVEPDVIYEDSEQVFPHIYGPLNISAVTSVKRVLRSDDGTFLEIGGLLGRS